MSNPVLRVLLAAALLGCNSEAPPSTPSSDAGGDDAPSLVARPGEGVGELRIGMTYDQVVEVYGEVAQPLVFNGMAVAQLPDLGLELFFASPTATELASDAVLQAISADGDDAAIDGSLKIGQSRASIEDQLGLSPDIVGPVHYFPFGVAIEFDDQDAVSALSIFAPYELATRPPEMLPAATTGAPFQPAAPLSGGGMDVGGQMIDVVDTHLHTGRWGQQPRTAKEFVAEVQPAMFRLYAPALVSSSLDPYAPFGIGSQLRATGGSLAILFATYAQKTVGYSTNRQLEAMLTDPRNDGWAVGLASIDVDGIEDSEVRASRVAALSSYFTAHPGLFVGIKLAHAHQGVALDDEVMLDVYNVAAEHGVPVLLHTGFSPFPGSSNEPAFYDPGRLASIVPRYDGAGGRPRVEFVLAHVGQSDARSIAAAYALAQAHDNVWLEVSALRSPLRIDADGEPVDATDPQYPDVLAEILDRDLVDRTLWGSDGPQFAGFVQRFAGEVVDAMIEAGYTTEQIAAVMAGNARRLYLGAQP